MKEYYPYTVVPFPVEKIRLEGIPAPKLPKLMMLPQPVRRKYFFTVVFILSLAAFVFFAVFTRKYIFYSYISFFVVLISLVATIFEYVLYVNLKKQYEKDYTLYLEHKEIYKKVKSEQEKIMEQNKNEKIVKQFQREQVLDFFKTSYDVIIASHNEYSQPKKRFKFFLEQYFPDEVLENIKISHETKKIEYVPDFIIKFNNPKLNVSIEVEEPYSLSNIPENIQKDYEAKDRIRQRIANELGWIIIVLSEEQAVKSPTESCKFIEESIELLFGDIKTGDRFVNIKTIKKQKMLTGEERAVLKTTRYREKYLSEAGLLDHDDESLKDFSEIIHENNEKSLDLSIEKNELSDKKENNLIKQKDVDLTEITENKENIEPDKKEISNKSEIKETEVLINSVEEKKTEVENEQLLLIKKIAHKAKIYNEKDDRKIVEQEPVVFKTDDSLEIKKNNGKNEDVSILNEVVEETEILKTADETFEKSEQLRREDEILKNLYNALDKHSRKQKERKEKHQREKQFIKSEVVSKNDLTILDKSEEKIEETLTEIQSEDKLILSNSQKIDDQIVEDSLPEKISEVTKVESEKSVKKVELEELKSETIENPNIVETNVEPENEDVTATEKHDALLENRRKVIEQTRKNQEIMQVYREKIEGAVFDKKWDELIELCNNAIKEIPQWDWAYYRRSTAWGNKKDFAKVLQDCNKAIGLNPTLADAYYNRGTARFFLGKYMDSAEDYQKSIDLNYFRKADAFFNRGLCFQKMDHHKTAYLEFVKSKELGSQKAIDLIKAQYKDFE